MPQLWQQGRAFRGVTTFRIKEKAFHKIQNENHHPSNTLAHCICSNSSGQAGSPIHPIRAIEYGMDEPKCRFHA